MAQARRGEPVRRLSTLNLPKLTAAIIVLLVLGVAIAAQRRPPAPAQEPASPTALEGPPANLPEAKIAGELPGSRVSPEEITADWPAAAVTSDGATWVAWIEWDGKGADRVVLRRSSDGAAWAAPIVIEDGNWDHYSPALVSRGGRVLALWSAQAPAQPNNETNYDLYAAEVDASGKVSKPERLTSAPYSDFNARAVSDTAGNVTVVWQSFRSGQADIYARRLSGSRWGAEVRISPSEANDWEPAVALDSRGAAWIAWDSYAAGNYDVMLRSFDGRAAGALVPVTAEPDAQFHSSVAVDRDDRVWIAWDEGGRNWGKDFSRSSAAPGSRGLHFSRSLNVRVWQRNRLQEPAADLSTVLTGRMSRYAELPHLAVDGAGSLWMVFRHWTWTKPNEIYHFYATRLEGGQWTMPLRLSNSSGQNSQRAGIARAKSGALLVAYSSDGRSPVNVPRDQMHALHYNVYLASLESKAAPGAGKLNDVTLPPPAIAPPPRPRASLAVAEKSYTLLWGDAHRHTDIRGHSGVDASVLDTYRYALDAAQLDWLGTSDHNEVVGGTWPDGLRDYQWWWTQKAVDLFSHPPRFIGVYSYEHSMARPGGHRNILFLKRGAPLRAIDRSRGLQAPDNAPPELWKWAEENVLTEAGQKMVIVPHTFAAGPLADWNWPNARFDCLLEIYQGCRGSYEAWRQPPKEKRGPTQTDEPGHFAQDALAKGNVYGFVSFSDHASTHNSWAGVWVERATREGLLDAMLARRTYAASDEIVLKVTAAGRMVGEKFAAPAGTPLELVISIAAPDTILRVDVVRNGQFIFTRSPAARTAELRFRDSDPPKGSAYYYVRVFQRDPENPDGDPEIAWSSPFFVTYP